MLFINFKNKEDFFYQSSVYRNAFISVVNHNLNNIPNDDDLHLCLRLWAESIVKHNLSISSIETDLLILVDHHNSELVEKTFYPIINTPKEVRSQKDFDLLQTFRNIQKTIHLSYVYPNIKNGLDIYEKIKMEFLTYSNQKYVPWTQSLKFKSQTH